MFVLLWGEAEIWEEGTTNAINSVLDAHVLIRLTIGFYMTLTIGNICDLLDDPTAFNYKYFCHIFGTCSLIYRISIS